MPYSRISVDNMHTAIGSYITKDQCSQLEAAMLMGCESRLTFRLYYFKVMGCLSDWTSTITMLIRQIGKGVEPPNLTTTAEYYKTPTSANWKKYNALISKYVRVQSELPDGEVITEACYYGYIYPRLGWINMKSGP